MLEKLNEIANQIAELISQHSAKKGKPLEGSSEEEALESPAAEASEDAPASKAQKSIRKSMGGMKEPK